MPARDKPAAHNSASRTLVYRSPHESHRFKNSHADVMRRVAQNIAQFCPPAPNWDQRRRDLRDRVRALLWL